MKSVLVTGASGFIGRHLVRALTAQGCRVRCLVRPASSVRHLRRADAGLVIGDVTHPDSLPAAMQGVDTVYHLAGMIQASDAERLKRINAQGTANVVQACARRTTPPTLVYVSSLAAAGPTGRHRVRDVSDPPAPVSVYGRSKRGGEIAVESCAAQVPCTIVRPGIVFGPWDRVLLPVFRSIAKIGIHPIPTFSPPPLSMIHVDDLAQLLVAAGQRGTRLASTSVTDGNGRPPGYYFACANEYPNYADVGRMIAQSVGRRHVFLYHLAEPLPWLVAGTTEFVARLANIPVTVNLDKMREAIAGSWASSPQAACDQLGFAPRYKLCQRLDQTAQWYRRRGWM